MQKYKRDTISKADLYHYSCEYFDIRIQLWAL